MHSVVQSWRALAQGQAFTKCRFAKDY